MNLPELPSLREPYNVEAILQVFVQSEVLADHVHLVVDILEEAIKHIGFDAVTDLNGADIDAGHLLTHHLHQVTHAE